MSDGASQTAYRRLFHARGAATENARSPNVDCLMTAVRCSRHKDGTVSVLGFVTNVDRGVAA